MPDIDLNAVVGLTIRRSMANPRESELHYVLGDRLPEPGDVLDVAPGIRWLRMGLPFALDHINLWLLRDRQGGAEGWTIVDCGIASADTKQAWEQVFANHLDGLPVLRVICTHMHPDHIGLADWLCERFGCRLWISAADWATARIAVKSTTGVGGDAAADFFASHGLNDPEMVDKVRRRANHFAQLVPRVPAAYHRLFDGMEVEIGGHPWRCIVGYGHAPEHIALHAPSRGVLIAGDMVLPRISTNVSGHDIEPEANSLQLYLDSIGKLLALPAETLVLPSHGKPFVGLHQRIDQLIEHHGERYAEVMAACAEAPQSAADLLPVLFKRPLDLHQTTFAIGEAIAHLHALWFSGELLRQVDARGVIRFSPAHA